MAIKHLSQLHNAILGAGVAIVSVNSDGVVSPAALQGTAQPTINAFDDSDAAEAARLNIAARSIAGTVVDTDKGPHAKLLRAITAVLLDEFNLHALKINGILDAVDGAASLAALKTAIAAIPDHPQRTLPQLVTAIKNKINAGTVD